MKSSVDGDDTEVVVSDETGWGTGKPRAGRSRCSPHGHGSRVPSPVSCGRRRHTPGPGRSSDHGKSIQGRRTGRRPFAPRSLITSNSLKLTACGEMNRANGAGFTRPRLSRGLFLGTGVPVQGLNGAVTHPRQAENGVPPDTFTQANARSAAYGAPGLGPFVPGLPPAEVRTPAAVRSALPRKRLARAEVSADVTVFARDPPVCRLPGVLCTCADTCRCSARA